MSQGAWGVFIVGGGRWPPAPRENPRAPPPLATAGPRGNPRCHGARAWPPPHNGLPHGGPLGVRLFPFLFYLLISYLLIFIIYLL
jgi:hypothetical protein